MLRHPGSDLNRDSFPPPHGFRLVSKQPLLKGPPQVPGDPSFHWRDHLSDFANKDGATLSPHPWAHPCGLGDLSGGDEQWNTVSKGEGRARRTDTWDRTGSVSVGTGIILSIKIEMSSLGKRLLQTIQQNHRPSMELRKKAHEMGSVTGWASKMQLNPSRRMGFRIPGLSQSTVCNYILV